MPDWWYAYNTNGLAHHRLEEAIDLVADLGYGGLSLTPDVGHLDPRDATAADVARTDAQLRRRGLRVTIQTGARFVLDPRRKHRPDLLDPDADAREARLRLLERCMDIGRDLGAGVVSFWSGTPQPRESVVDVTKRLIDGCRRVADGAAARGMQAAFEPEPGMFVATVRDWVLLRNSVNHPAFRLALDVGHVHCNREGDLVRIVRNHAADLGDLQIEDMREGEHVHLAFGEGTLDPAPVLLALREMRYRGPVVVELSRDSHRAPEVARAALETLRRICP
jgi:sugar phosphate isomerase/epimerase